jgi:hypothetical protein
MRTPSNSSAVAGNHAPSRRTGLRGLADSPLCRDGYRLRPLGAAPSAFRCQRRDERARAPRWKSARTARFVSSPCSAATGLARPACCDSALSDRARLPRHGHEPVIRDHRHVASGRPVVKRRRSPTCGHTAPVASPDVTQTKRTRLLPTGNCFCGCGGEAEIGRWFVRGHDITAAAALRAVRAG